MTNAQLNVRACAFDEVSSVLALWQRERSSHAAIPDSPEGVQRLLEHDPASLLVAEIEGEIVGALIAVWDGWRGNMYRLVISDEHRRNGVGRALVLAGEERLRAEGARRITALVAFEDARASTFWEAAGYPRDPVMGRRVKNL